jgi:carboxyl-terminal processing protease
MTTMKFPRRRGIFALLLTATATIGLLASTPAIGQSEKPAAAPAAAPNAVQAKPATDETAKQWSAEVWTAAMHGDRKALDRYFRELPADGQAAEGSARFKQAVDLHQTNSDKAKTKRDESRDKAMTELREHVEKNDLPKALRSAVTVQTLSDDMSSALTDPDIAKIISWAKEQIPQVEEKLDWLQAAELLYCLRTLYEDTGHTDEYKEYYKQLDWVNRRVSLLAQYAPKRLWELRAARAERMGDKPLGEYKPPAQADWKERFDGVRPEMVKSALRIAADNHIEAKGWKPLLVGGLEELKILATTASLDETFEKLQDPEMVARWVGYIDQQLATIQQSKDAELDAWTLSHLLDGLTKMNEETVQLPRAVVYREFGDGAMYSLDQFSEIIWPDKLARFRQATEGNFVGVGIIIRHNETQDIIVVNPIEGTPAYFGGVKPEDVISEVDGESTVGWSLNDAVDRITGAPATKVTLGMKREGTPDLIPMTLDRKVIKLRSVLGWFKKNLGENGVPEWNWYIDPVSRVAYIRITQFTEDTFGDLLDAWEQVVAEGKPSGLIIDLRFNPGGLLTAAVQVSNMFVRQGVIVSGEDKDGRKAWSDQKARPENALLDGIPTVVLVNQGSASASEIVSGCLQAHHSAVILGERSFGKGSVQTVHQTDRDGKARIKLTTQYYRLPDMLADNGEPMKGRLVHKRPGATDWGVNPDIIVKMTPDQITESLELRQKCDVIPQDETGKLNTDPTARPDVNKLLTDGMDPQLETALLILQARALGNVGGNDTQHAALNKNEEAVAKP